MRKPAYPCLVAGLMLFGCLNTACDSKKPGGIAQANAQMKAQTTSAPASTNKELIKRGEYLVVAVGCDDCHSPKVMTPHGPEPDPARRLSGHPADMPLPAIPKEATKDWVLFNQQLTAYVGPWGVSYAANITSDPSGIGNWTEKQFFTAIRKGKYKGLENNRSLLPPMPWPQFAHFNDEDLRSIFAYLKSTKPIRNVVPAHQPPGKP